MIDVATEEHGNFCELRVTLASQISRAELDVQISNHGVRIACNSVVDACEIPLTATIQSEEATVKWRERSHELCFNLPLLIHEALPGPGTPEAVSTGLLAHDHHVIDGFVPEALGRRIASRVAAWYASGSMKPGVVGNSATPLPFLSNIRGDVILDLEEGDDPDIAVLLQKFDALAVALSRQVPVLQHVVRRSRAMIAVYPPDSCGYLKHVDNSGRDSRDQRRLTCIYYLNFDWSADCGGALRLHLSDRIVDVAPVGGRFACFWADTVEHEVLVSARQNRMAVSVWYSEPLPSTSPERQLPVQAVHCLAAELMKAGAVKLPEWTSQLFSSSEFAAAAQALSTSFCKDGSDLLVQSSTSGDSNALHSALTAIRKAGTTCYHRASRVVANCIGVGEHLLGMLVRSGAPGWAHIASALVARAVAITTLQPGMVSAMRTQRGAVLGCVFGLLPGNRFSLSVSGKGQSDVSQSISAGDVLLIDTSHAKDGRWKVSSAERKPIIRIEVWF